jgi:RimJ/RimL family protein N-acetyltransferase
MEITLERIGPKGKRNTGLFEPLIQDAVLLKEGIGIDSKLSLADFNKYNKEWAAKNKAECFAIVAKDSTIGMISLSHIDFDKKEACTGYFIGGKFRNQGYATQAFKIITDRAKELGIKHLHSTIDKQNLPSLSIWQKYNSVIKNKGDNLYLTLELDKVS